MPIRTPSHSKGVSQSTGRLSRWDGLRGLISPTSKSKRRAIASSLRWALSGPSMTAINLDRAKCHAANLPNIAGRRFPQRNFAHEDRMRSHTACRRQVRKQIVLGKNEEEEE